MYKLQFYKENGIKPMDRLWYIDLPEHKGPKEDLQMVAGADILLDIISGGTEKIMLSCSINPEFEDFKKHIVLTKIDEDKDGAYYYVSQYYFYIRLCNVIKFIFNGQFPEKIFCNF